MFITIFYGCRFSLLKLIIITLMHAKIQKTYYKMKIVDNSVKQQINKIYNTLKNTF